LYLPPPRSSEEDFWSLQLPKSSIGRDWDPNLVGTLSPASPLTTRNNKKKETNTSTRIWSQHFNNKNDSERSPPLLQVASDKLWTPSKALPNTTITTHERRRVLDYRFGPIEIDWIKMNNPNPSSSPSPSPSPSVESGTSSLYWGTIHLYREGGIPLEYESSSREKQLAKDLDDGKTLGMISVPGNLNASAVLKFIASNYNNNQQEQQQGSGSGLEDLKQVRMLRDSTPSRSLVVLQFYDREKAKKFRDKFNGKKYYDSKDSELCHVVPISSILIKTSLEPPYTTTTKVTVKEEDANPRAGEQIEIPTCPICLERLDSKVTGLIQVSCKHNFHCNCLLRWGDSRCPVCRATNLPSSSSKEGGQGRVLTNNCNVCNSPSNLWICIICGNVGCGRYQGGHAHSHFSETGHS
jgi:BRCA1-associated protein